MGTPHFSMYQPFWVSVNMTLALYFGFFRKLSLKDQITLLKSGCTEILFIKANYTYDREQNALMCGPGKYYTRESFILGLLFMLWLVTGISISWTLNLNNSCGNFVPTNSILLLQLNTFHIFTCFKQNCGTFSENIYPW